jgi:zinc protease
MFKARVLLLLLAGALIAAPARAQRFAAETFALDNGMQVVVAPNHRVPAVTQMVWYKVGAADDPLGKSGVAHFLEHLMFKGTEATPPGAFAAMIGRDGGPAEDYTAYYETVARDRLELVMRLEADRMTGLVLDDPVVLPERDVVLEERRLRIDNEPVALLAEQLRATLFLHHPYRNPNIGWENEIHRLGTADALAFYRSWYAPNNAILVIAGDVATPEVRALAERYFAPIPSRPVPVRSRVDEPRRHAAARLEMKSPRAAQPRWSRSYLAASYGRGDTSQAYALQVLAEILGGGAGSRLHQSLVLDRGLALSAGAGYSPGAIDLSSFRLWATPKPGVAIGDLEAAVEAELQRLIRDGVDPGEVRRPSNACRMPRSMPRTASRGQPRSSAPGSRSGRASMPSKTGRGISARSLRPQSTQRPARSCSSATLQPACCCPSAAPRGCAGPSPPSCWRCCGRAASMR